MNIRWNLVWAIVVRHFYNFRHTYDRLVDAFYWPALDILIWGLTISSFKGSPDTVALRITSVLIGMVLWYVIWRGQYEITVNILEEIWNENLANIFVTPITLWEWLLGLFSMGILKLFLTISFTALLCWIMYLVNVFKLGFLLIPFIISLLITGWSFGMIIGGLFLRFGSNIQTLAWAGGSILMPFSGTFYSLSSLPLWMQKVAVFVPSSYIFEGMRQVLFTGQVQPDYLYKSFILNGIYFALTLWFFVRSFKRAKINGLGHIK